MIRQLLIYLRSKRSIHRAYLRGQDEIRHLAAVNQAQRIDVDNQRDLLRRINWELEVSITAREVGERNRTAVQGHLDGARADASAWRRTAEQWRMRAAQLEADNQVLATQSLNLATTLHTTGVMEWDPLTTAIIEATQVPAEMSDDGLTQIFDEVVERRSAPDSTQEFQVVCEARLDELTTHGGVAAQISAEAAVARAREEMSNETV